MDFADALHLGASATCEAMLAFDRQSTMAAADHSLHVTMP